MEKSIDIKALTEYAVSEGTQNTEDGSWETSYEELYNHFDVEIERGDDACKELAEALRQRKEVRDLTITEDGIDVSYAVDDEVILVAPTRTGYTELTCHYMMERIAAGAVPICEVLSEVFSEIDHLDFRRFGHQQPPW